MGGRDSDPPRPESIWRRADNEPVNAPRPSVRDAQSGHGAEETAVLALFTLFSVPSPSLAALVYILAPTKANPLSPDAFKCD